MPDATRRLAEKIESQEIRHQVNRNEDLPMTLNPYEEKYHSEFCFISMVFGFFGLILPLFSTLAIVLGIAGLMQINREKMKGRWMAITGISLGFAGIIIIIVAILFGVKFLENYFLNFGGAETLIGSLAN